MTTIYYRPPSRFFVGFYKLMNPLICFLVRRFGVGGRGVDLLRILRVRGRKSGRLHEVPVRVAVLSDQRYIISMLGDTQWARNLRAAGTADLIVGRTVEPVRAHEIQAEEKTAFLTRCCRYRQFEQRARFTLKVAFKLKVKQLAAAEIDLLAGVWSVFRLEPERNERATT